MTRMTPGRAVALPFLLTAWCLCSPARAEEPARIPLIHTSDLYHPYQDLDDHFDLAAVYAIPEYDLRAIVLDNTTKFLKEGRSPGAAPVAQLNLLTKRSVPSARGPVDALKSLTDPAQDRPPDEQAGIELLLKTLRESPAPAVVSVVGSARVLAAAYNREPKLLEEKVRAVLLNAGSTGKYIEWNVNLDRWAYVRLFRSGLTVHWYPCANQKGPFEPNDEHTTFWKGSHAVLLKDLPPPLFAFFAYATTRNTRQDPLKYLSEPVPQAVAAQTLKEDRNLWSIPSLVLAAGRVLAKTEQGWRFVPKAKLPAGAPVFPLELEPVTATVADSGIVEWKPAPGPSQILLYKRRPGPECAAALNEATNALLRAFPLAAPAAP